LVNSTGDDSATSTIIASQGWLKLDTLSAQLMNIRRERLKLEKQEDILDFELRKAEFKLDQAERRVSAIDADLTETDRQTSHLLKEGVFLPSEWSMRKL
jgi:chromosome segregation ATPase